MQQQRKRRTRKTRLERVCIYFIVTFTALPPPLPYPILSYFTPRYRTLPYLTIPYPTLPNPTLSHPTLQLTILHYIGLYLTPSPLLYYHLDSWVYRTSPHHPGLRRPQGHLHDSPNTAGVRDPAFHAAQAHQIQCERRGLCVYV
jgi:hypothetical protein